MADKQTILITGGTSGVGFNALKVLVAKGHNVIFTGRNTNIGETIAKDNNATFLQLDLASQANIRQFVENLKEKLEHPLHTVVCNAGIQFATNTNKNEDGYETTFAVNHLGHFLLVQLLLKENLISKPARIIVVASGTHDPAQQTGVEPPRFKTAEQVSKGDFGADLGTGMKAGLCCYSTSKLCNILFAFELNRKLRESNVEGICVNAFDPGLTPGTGLARNGYWIVSTMFRYMPAWVLQMMWSNVHTTEDSGTSLAELCISPAYDKLYGHYFEHENRKPFIAESSVDSNSREFAEDLWNFSLQATGLEQ